MNFFKLLAMVCAIGFVMMNGCSSMPDSNQRTVPQSMIDTSNPRAKLIVGSKKLVNKIVLLDPRFRVLGQMTQAEVTVQNLTDDRYTLEYKYDWEDSQGFSVDSRSMWHRFTLTARQTQRFQSTGKTPEAVNIIFTIRLPDDAFIEMYKQEEK